MGTSLKRLAGAGLLLAILTGAAPSVAPPPPAPRTLMVLGDSITCGMVSRAPSCGSRFRGFGTLQEQLLAQGTFGNVIVDAVFARNAANVPSVTRNGATTLTNYLAAGTQVDALIVALGSNDLQHSPRPSYYERNIRQILDLAAGRPVAWVTVHRSDQRWYPRRAQTFNEVLVRLAAEYPNLTVVDWVPTLMANPGWLANDRLHLNPDGYRARIATYLEASNGLWGRIASADPSATTTTTVPAG